LSQVQGTEPINQCPFLGLILKLQTLQDKWIGISFLKLLDCLNPCSTAVTECLELSSSYLIVLEPGKSNIKVPLSGEGLLSVSSHGEEWKDNREKRLNMQLQTLL
jgi:hypothetical protein